MKFLIIFAFVWTTVFGLPANEVKSRNIIVPVGTAEGRITHGYDSGIKSYQVGLLQYKGENKMTWCGGTLISHTEVLTAAHCTEDANKIDVILGTTNRRVPKVTHTVSPKNFVIHPGYDTNTSENDISIIHIPWTNFTKEIHAANLPTGTSSSYVGKIAVASGWGRILDTLAGGTDTLKYAHFNVIPNNVCEKTFNIQPSNICVATHHRISTCQGDSGGPLVLQDSNTVIGVTSFGSANGCEKNLPTVFTRVSSYLDWIHKNIKLSA